MLWLVLANFGCLEVHSDFVLSVFVQTALAMRGGGGGGCFCGDVSTAEMWFEAAVRRIPGFEMTTS